MKLNKKALVVCSLSLPVLASSAYAARSEFAQKLFDRYPSVYAGVGCTTSAVAAVLVPAAGIPFSLFTYLVESADQHSQYRDTKKTLNAVKDVWTVLPDELCFDAVRKISSRSTLKAGSDVASSAPSQPSAGSLNSAGSAK